MPECVSAAVSRAGSRTGGRGGYDLVMLDEVHFVKIVQGGNWGDRSGAAGEGLVRFGAGSLFIGTIVGSDGDADSLWVRFGMLCVMSERMMIRRWTGQT